MLELYFEKMIFYISALINLIYTKIKPLIRIQRDKFNENFHFYLEHDQEEENTCIIKYKLPL